MLTETNLRCFISLVETLNFTRTAKDLYMSQQAVSQHISRLEQNLGFPLFVRTRRSVALTQGGKEMFDFWSRTFQEFSQLKALCRSRYSSYCGTMWVGYQDWMNFGPAVGAALNQFETAFPDAIVESLRADPGLLLQRLSKRELNLAVMYDRFTQGLEHIKRIELMRAPLMLMISPTNPKAKEGATFKDFIEEPFVLDAFPNEPANEAMRRAKKEVAMCGLKPSKIIITNSRDSAYTEAELGRGFVISTGVSRISVSSDLCKYPIGQDERIVCIWNEDEDNPLVKEYAKLLAEAYNEGEPPVE